MPPLNMSLDPMGEQPALFKLYTQLLFIFPLSASTNTATQTNITTTLTRGLARLSAALPWTAGQVVNANTDPLGTAMYRIVDFEPTPRLVVQDYKSDSRIPSLEEMQEKNFPMSLLGEQTWAPCPTLAGLSFDPSMPSGSADSPAPVLLLQASFIRGGVVLCVNAQHNVMDMVGQGQVMSLLSRACKGEPFTEEDIRVGNLERKDVVETLADDWEPGKELDMQIINKIPAVDTNAGKEMEQEVEVQAQAQAPPTPTRPKCTWSYITFSASSLRTLKDQATSTLPANARYTSTDDALSALIFQSILRARSTRLSADQTVKLARAVDVRRYLSMPPGYPGVLQNMTYHAYTLSQLLSLSLGEIATEMRSQVDPDTSSLAYNTRSLITYLQRDPGNRSKVNITAAINVDSDIMLSSWSKVDGYSFDFGLGAGKPVAVRRPAFVPVESLMYLMPKAADMSIALGLCLREDDMIALRADEEFAKFGTYVG